VPKQASQTADFAPGESLRHSSIDPYTMFPACPVRGRAFAVGVQGSRAPEECFRLHNGCRVEFDDPAGEGRHPERPSGSDARCMCPGWFRGRSLRPIQLRLNPTRQYREALLAFLTAPHTPLLTPEYPETET
jgi:hypothetical protein